MYRDLSLDVGLDRQHHGAAWRTCRYVLLVNRAAETVPLVFVAELEEDRRAKIALGIRDATELDPSQVVDSLMDVPGHGAYVGDDTVQFPQLREQHAAGELAHAILIPRQHAVARAA